MLVLSPDVKRPRNMRRRTGPSRKIPGCPGRPSWRQSVKPLTRTLCHVFTERPIYRPEEPVLFRGYVRDYVGGKIALTKKGGTLVVAGPNNQEWRIPVKPMRWAASITSSMWRRLRPATTRQNSNRTARSRKRKRDDGTARTAKKGRLRRIRPTKGGERCAADRRADPQTCGDTAFRRKPTNCRPSRSCSTRRRWFRSTANSPST